MATQDDQVKEVKYALKNDKEMGRLNTQHPVLKDAIGGSLVLPPIDLSGGGRRILDSGTADGLWLRDLAATLGQDSNQYYGTDINPDVYPQKHPSNFHYSVQDVNAPWPAQWANSFDLVHQRVTLAAGGPHMLKVVTNLTELVKPGGWIQLMESEQIHGDDDGPAMRQFVKLMHDLFTSLGAPPVFCNVLRKGVEQAGFVDIHEQTFELNLGPKNKNPKLGQQIIASTCIAVESVIKYIKTLPKGAISISEPDLDNLVENLRTELSKQGAEYPMRVVWARKPKAKSE